MLQEIATLSMADRQEIFRVLRQEISLHPIERRWHTTAEIMLEAIDRSSELTKRMFRGVLAEAACKIHVINEFHGWRDIVDHQVPAADFVLEKDGFRVSIQAKLLRSAKEVPLRADQVRSLGSADHFVVETQKTRSGKDSTGSDTRPYHFGEFDILAVSLYPLSHRWSDFMFVPARWLVPRNCDSSLISIYQPVSPRPDDDWTNDLGVCIERLRSAVSRTIGGVTHGQPKKRRQK